MAKTTSLQDRLRTKLTKKYGEGSVSVAADRKALAYIPYGISAQCLTLDLLIGRPGFPAGRLTEICALEHRGKCVTGDTIIDCPRNLNECPEGIPIREMVGESHSIYAYSRKHHDIRVVHGVSPFLSGKNRQIYRVEYQWVTPSGKHYGEIFTTGNHPFLLLSGHYKNCVDLKRSDRLQPVSRGLYEGRSHLICDGDVFVVKVEKAGRADVYDMEVPKYHNFIANGLVVHNSTIGYHVLAQCQKQGGLGVLIETENAFEASRLETLGVNTNDLVLLQPVYIEQALDMILQTMISLRVDSKFDGPLAIILDTVARTPSSAEFEGNFDQQQMAHAARVISMGLRKLVRPLGAHKAVLIFMNQLTNTMERYGEKFTSYGGQSIKSTASLRMHLEFLKKDLEYAEGRKLGELEGARVKAYTMKNKLSLPFQDTRFYLNFHTGIDQVDDLWTAALKIGVLRPSKGTFSLTLGKKQASVSREKWGDFILTNFKMLDAFRARLVTVALEKGLLSSYGK
jgi:recombination protein RecA